MSYIGFDIILQTSCDPHFFNLIVSLWTLVPLFGQKQRMDMHKMLDDIIDIGAMYRVPDKNILQKIDDVDVVIYQIKFFLFEQFLILICDLNEELNEVITVKKEFVG